MHVEVAPSVGLIGKLLEREFDFVLARVPEGIDQRQFVTAATRPEIIISWSGEITRWPGAACWMPGRSAISAG